MSKTNLMLIPLDIFANDCTAYHAASNSSSLIWHACCSRVHGPLVLTSLDHAPNLIMMRLRRSQYPELVGKTICHSPWSEKLSTKSNHSLFDCLEYIYSISDYTFLTSQWTDFAMIDSECVCANGTEGVAQANSPRMAAISRRAFGSIWVRLYTGTRFSMFLLPAAKKTKY